MYQTTIGVIFGLVLVYYTVFYTRLKRIMKELDNSYVGHPNNYKDFSRLFEAVKNRKGQSKKVRAFLITMLISLIMSAILVFVLIISAVVMK